MSKAYPNHKYVAYTSKMGRTEAGVYERYVDIVGDCAYIRPLMDGSKADILPAANVFEKQDDALAYMAGGGVKKWIVDTGRWRDGVVTLPFQGRVAYCTVLRHGRYDFVNSAVRDSDGKVFSGRDVKTFDTHKDAEKFHARVWKERMKEVLEEYQKKHAQLVEMRANKPRSRKRAK